MKQIKQFGLYVASLRVYPKHIFQRRSPCMVTAHAVHTAGGEEEQMYTPFREVR